MSAKATGLSPCAREKSISSGPLPPLGAKKSHRRQDTRGRKSQVNKADRCQEQPFRLPLGLLQNTHYAHFVKTGGEASDWQDGDGVGTAWQVYTTRGGHTPAYTHHVYSSYIYIYNIYAQIFAAGATPKFVTLFAQPGDRQRRWFTLLPWLMFKDDPNGAIIARSRARPSLSKPCSSPHAQRRRARKKSSAIGRAEQTGECSRGLWRIDKGRRARSDVCSRF